MANFFDFQRLRDRVGTGGIGHTAQNDLMYGGLRSAWNDRLHGAVGSVENRRMEIQGMDLPNDIKAAMIGKLYKPTPDMIVNKWGLSSMAENHGLPWS